MGRCNVTHSQIGNKKLFIYKLFVNSNFILFYFISYNNVTSI